jgi:hypothetical protein
MFCYGFHHGDRYERDEPVPVVEVGETRDPDLRVSQAERDAMAATLARHYADGRLSVDEYEERVTAALAARTGGDLDALVADLPADVPAPASTPPPTTDWRRVAPYVPRVLGVAAVVVLALGNGLWVLWFLWPVLIMTSPRRHRARQRYAPAYGAHRPHRPRYRYDRAAARWL